MRQLCERVTCLAAFWPCARRVSLRSGRLRMLRAPACAPMSVRVRVAPPRLRGLYERQFYTQWRWPGGSGRDKSLGVYYTRAQSRKLRQCSTSCARRA
eukprot:1926514-Prymnesium_polylepis.1